MTTSEIYMQAEEHMVTLIWNTARDRKHETLPLLKKTTRNLSEEQRATSSHHI